MPKLLSIFLLAAFLLPPFAPLLASGPQSDANLPACCRRDGKHHCRMSMAERALLANSDPSFESLPDKCPYAPATAISFASPVTYTTPQPAQAIFAALVSHPAGSPQTESLRRISRDRSRRKRGPPSILLLA